jgi:hypothetical protein
MGALKGQEVDALSPTKTLLCPEMSRQKHIGKA